MLAGVACCSFVVFVCDVYPFMLPGCFCLITRMSRVPRVDGVARSFLGHRIRRTPHRDEFYPRKHPRVITTLVFGDMVLIRIVDGDRVPLDIAVLHGALAYVAFA